MHEPSAQSSANEQPQSDPTTVIVVRHACAGDKDEWPGDDAERPLDEGGIRQAAALADALADASVQRLVASPMKRCMDTLKPLSARLQLDIEPCEALSPDGSIEVLLRENRHSLAGTVLCTHGELMRRYLERLHAEGVVIHAEHHEDEWLLTKGSAWRLAVGSQGHVTELKHVAPLPLPNCGAHAASD